MLRMVLSVLISLQLISCASDEKKVEPQVLNPVENAALMSGNACGNSAVAECILVVGAVTAAYVAARQLGLADEQKVQTKGAKPGLVVVKCYMVDPDSQFQYPCGPALVSYKNLKKHNSLRMRGETFELLDFPNEAALEIKLDKCKKSQSLEKVKTGTVVHVQFSTACEI